MVGRVLNIVLLSLLALTSVYCQNGQQYIGRTLGDTTISTTDIKDTSVSLAKLKYLNGLRILGNPTGSYAIVKEIIVGSNLSFSGDTLKASGGGGGGSGDVLQNGNSFGATMNLGTNDNNNLRLETNGVPRFEITSGASTGGLGIHNVITTNTTTPDNVLTFKTNSTGTPGVGFGSRILFQGESSTTDNMDMASIDAIWRTATHSGRNGNISFKLVKNGGALSEYFKFSDNGSGELSIGVTAPVVIGTSSFTTGENFTIGNSVRTLALSSSANSNTAILINGSNTNTPNCTLGNSNFNNTSAHKQMMQTGTSLSFNPTSGTGTFTGYEFNWTINQTGGANGVTRAFHVNPTLTAAADFRAIDISSTSGKGIYQSSTGPVNHLVGNTHIGSTGTAVTKLQITNGRFAQAKGNDVTVANTLTLGGDGNVFKVSVSGNTNLNNIVSTNWPAGSVVTLIFTGAHSVSHNNTTGGGAAILLAGSIPMNVANNATLTLVYDGTFWQEISRKMP
ncbi:MAG: hypothetical protein IPP06_04100 [Saprospiraceae bacterium]|nr:hypothetical protein [Candidatus Vicinibacter affinis]